MRKVTLFTRERCHLCESAREVIDAVRQRVDFDFQMVDIDEPGQERWLDRYDREVPVVHLDDVEFARHRLDARALLSALKDRG